GPNATRRWARWASVRRHIDVAQVSARPERGPAAGPLFTEYLAERPPFLLLDGLRAAGQVRSLRHPRGDRGPDATGDRGGRARVRRHRHPGPPVSTPLLRHLDAPDRDRDADRAHQSLSRRRE